MPSRGPSPEQPRPFRSGPIRATNFALASAKRDEPLGPGPSLASVLRLILRFLAPPGLPATP